MWILFIISEIFTIHKVSQIDSIVIYYLFLKVDRPYDFNEPTLIQDSSKERSWFQGLKDSGEKYLNSSLVHCAEE